MQKTPTSKESQTPQTGNVNPQMGEANKKMIANRLADKNDPLTIEMVKLVCPDMIEVLDSVPIRSKDDSDLKNSEIAFMFEAKIASGEIITKEIAIASKGSMGLGSLNQLALFWLNTVLDENELKTPPGQALTQMAGCTKNGDTIVPSMPACDLITGIYSGQYGMPLQMWLGDENNLTKFIKKGLGVNPGELGKKVLLLNMRMGGLQGEDIFVMVDAGHLGNAILKEAIKETSKKQKYVKIDSEDKALKFSRAMSLKRIGGPIRGDASNQLQLIVKTKGLLSMIVRPEKDNELSATICLEDPRAESISISAMNENFDYSAKPEVSSDLEKMLQAVEKIAVDLDENHLKEHNTLKNKSKSV